MAHIDVTIVKTPVTARYIEPGDKGHFDPDTNRVRAGGVWFDYTPDRWKIVTEEKKKEEFLADLFKIIGYLTDYEFDQMIRAYAIEEETAMEWMVETDRFIRLPLNGAWSIKH
jgi:hypothetical protein